jgi:multiple sugar transport system permease protein
LPAGGVAFQRELVTDVAIATRLPNAPSAAKKQRAPRNRQFDGGDRRVAFLMAGIPTLLHVALVWIPTIASIALSFTNWKGIRFSDIEWVGFKNYEQIFTVFEKNFFQALINNSVLLIFLFIGPTAFGITLAYLLDKDIRGSRFYQSIFFTPVVLSLAVVGFMWQSVIYSTENGLATQLFGGGGPIDWIGNQTFLIPIGEDYGVSRNFVAILAAIAWRHAGYIMVLYLAGLKSVDNTLREAAMLDGSNEWQTFRNVIFPSLKPINVVVAVITVIEALRAFDIIFVLNTPRKTEVLSILTTNNLLGEGGGNVGRGSAYATILFLFCFGFVVWYVTNHYRQTQEGADS